MVRGGLPATTERVGLGATMYWLEAGRSKHSSCVAVVDDYKERDSPTWPGFIPCSIITALLLLHLKSIHPYCRIHTSLLYDRDLIWIPDHNLPHLLNDLQCGVVDDQEARGKAIASNDTKRVRVKPIEILVDLSARFKEEVLLHEIEAPIIHGLKKLDHNYDPSRLGCQNMAKIRL